MNIRTAVAVRISNVFIMTARAKVSSRKRSALNRNFLVLRGKLNVVKAPEGLPPSLCPLSIAAYRLFSSGADRKPA